MIVEVFRIVIVVLVAVEVHDHWWRTPHEEPPLQVDTSSEHALPGSSPSAAHWHSIAEQAPWALGTSKLPAPLNLQVSQYLRAVVQCSICYYRREGKLMCSLRETTNLNNELNSSGLSKLFPVSWSVVWEGLQI